MSYDLLVFQPDQAPVSRSEFLAWWSEQSKWSEGHSYADPVVSTPALRNWFLDMIATWPAMNGPFAPAGWPDDVSSVVDYSVGRSMIYAGFRWPAAERAHQAVFTAAAKHGVGFFNASSDLGEVWLPDGNGGLALKHSA